MKLYLFRHGYTRYNLEKRYQGRTDLPLIREEFGRIRPYFNSKDHCFDPRSSEAVLELPIPMKEEGQTGRKLSGYFTEEAVYVSPALRARQTAGLLLPGMRQIVIPEFMEMDFGIFEGRSAEEMESDSQYRSWVDSMCQDPVPGGESLRQFTDRVSKAFERLAERSLREGKKILLIVAHGGTQMAIMNRYCTEEKPYWSWQSAPGEAVAARVIRKTAPAEQGIPAGDIFLERDEV